MWVADSLESLRQELASPGLRVVFVSQPDCAICEALLPKVADAVAKEPPTVMVYVDASVVTEVAGELSVLTVPVVLLMADGKEVHRQARFVQMAELERVLAGYAGMARGE